MNLPNKITIARIILAPLFYISYFLPVWTGMFHGLSSILILSIFVGIELSDFLDGYIARKYNLVSDLGKVLDPFADVLSRITYFLCFAFTGLMPLWIFLIIIYRELGITFLRMMMMGRGIVVAASLWGKLKAITYAISGILGVLYVSFERLEVFTAILRPLRASVLIVFYLSAFAALASFLAYLKGSKK
ncbi:MAG: CDP-diacylglycerol--glycerol-3-phosphate 3-phosphatidyltransferase [Spirochaetales bacterium]|nr:CDP-diacylglycerol--glycerol-3-phosphate 3-phosphatidyltransferase [Spirochaetales bacterium]